MAKQKKAETVSIKRNNVTKDVPKAQWDAMVKSKSTYGWKLASDLGEDVLAKDKEIEKSKTGELENEVKDLKSQVAEKDTKIGELENELTSYGITVDNLKLQIEKLTPKVDDKTPAKKK